MTFNWSDLAFGSKKPINNLGATFIAAPRALSRARFTQLVKTYLPKGNLVVGLAAEDYVLGLEGQPQFRMLQAETIQPVIDKVNAAATPHKIYTLHYSQRDTKHIYEKLDFTKVVLVNGSWYCAFHTKPEYYALANRGTPYQKVSPFTDEAEALVYEQAILKDIAAEQLKSIQNKALYSAAEMLAVANEVAKQSFDFGGYQIGVSLGLAQGKGYKLLATTHNNVVPFETYAMHYGASREQHFSPMHDLNHYDTIHAEVAMIIKAQQQAIDLYGTTLFINLLPCPTCARMFTRTDISEFVYTQDHSTGYAVTMLEAAGKKVRRVVPQQAVQ